MLLVLEPFGRAVSRIERADLADDDRMSGTGIAGMCSPAELLL